ncbi:hypothetical protein [Microbacterium sp. GXF7504]
MTGDDRRATDDRVASPTRRRWLPWTIAAAAVVVVAAATGGILLASAGGDADAVEPGATSSSPLQTPTPTAEAPAVALGGDCAAALTDAEAGDILGEAASPESRVRVGDGGVLGGVDCGWTGSSGNGLQVSVYPVGVVPAEVLALAGRQPQCDGGDRCEYAQVFGEAWVMARAFEAGVPERVVGLVGPRAEAAPGTPGAPGAGAWIVPDCDALREDVAAALGRSDLRPYAGDASPAGMGWDVLTANGAAGWCAMHGTGDDRYLEQISADFGPGSAGFPDAALAAAGATPVDVLGADRAFLRADQGPEGSTVYVEAGGNTLAVSARFLDQQALLGLAGDIVAGRR